MCVCVASVLLMRQCRVTKWIRAKQSGVCSSAGCHPRLRGCKAELVTFVSFSHVCLCCVCDCCTTEPQTSRQSAVEGSSAGRWSSASRGRTLLPLSAFGCADAVCVCSAALCKSQAGSEISCWSQRYCCLRLPMGTQRWSFSRVNEAAWLRPKKRIRG